MTPSAPVVQQVLDGTVLTRFLASYALYLNSHGREGQQVDLSCYVISDYDFSGLNLSSIYAQGTTFRRCRFCHTDLYGVNFSDASAPAADFSDAVLAKAEFHRSDLRGANFDGANLIQTFFLGCDLCGARFRGVDISGTYFDGSEVEGAISDQPLQVG